MPEPAPAGSLPRVSVIMPVFNEERFIGRSLGAVLAQDYPADLMEILVCDGRSTDRTREIVEGMKARHGGLRLVDNPLRTTATGLNAGIRAARGEIIVRIDGHAEIGPDFVRACVEELARTGADHVGGGVRAEGTTPFGRAVAWGTGTPFGAGGSRFRYSTQAEWVDTVFQGGWRRELFQRVGLFDEMLKCNEDDEFNFRLGDLGARILLSPRLASRYVTRATPWSLFRQYFRYGYWKIRVMQKHPGRMRPHHFAPAALVAALVCGGILGAVLGGLGWMPLAALLLAWNCGAALFTVRAAAGGLGRVALWLPLVYAILHISYGLGFLAGLVAFAGHWGDRGGHPVLEAGEPARGRNV